MTKEQLIQHFENIGLSQEWINAFSYWEGDTDDLDRSSTLVVFPYIKSERQGKGVKIKIYTDTDAVYTDTLVAYGLFSYTKGVLVNENGQITKRFVRGVDNAKTTTDILFICKTDAGWKLAILEGWRSKLKTVLEILRVKRARNLRAPYKVVLKGILEKNEKGFEFPSLTVLEISEGSDFPLPLEPALTLLKGHFLWRKGEQSFTPLYPATSDAQSSATDSEDNDDEEIEVDF